MNLITVCAMLKIQYKFIITPFRLDVLPTATTIQISYTHSRKPRKILCNKELMVGNVSGHHLPCIANCAVF